MTWMVKYKILICISTKNAQLKNEAEVMTKEKKGACVNQVAPYKEGRSH